MPVKKASRGKSRKMTRFSRRGKRLRRSRSRTKGRNSKSARHASPKKRGRKGRSVSSILLPMEGPKMMEDVKFNSYIRKVLKKVNPRVNLNGTSMKIMDSLMKDTLHQIAETASCKMGKRKTLKPKIILRAMKRVMPRKMALKVDEHAQKALERYSSKAKRRR